MKQVNRDCARYLKERPEAARILEGLRQRYEALGGVRGSFVLRDPSEAERLFLRGLFKKDYAGQRSISIPLAKFEGAFGGTRYDGVDLEGVLASYFQTPMVWQKTLAEQKAREREEFFGGLVRSLTLEELGLWLEEVLASPQSGAYKFLLGLYTESADSLGALLGALERLLAVCGSHAEGLSLPVAAAMATRDPHRLDPGTPLRRVLLYHLSHREGVPYPESAEETDGLLQTANLLMDSSTRTVLTYGLEGWDSGGEALGWLAFHRRREPLVLTGANLGKAESLTAVAPRVHCFENPAAFYARILRHPAGAAICTGGQVNGLVYRLMDALHQGGVLFDYSGDFDPEGLLIADKLKLRYPTLELTAFTGENYLRSLSDNPLSKRRLKQLDLLRDSRLVAVGELVRTHGKAGYQEYLIDA
ncbi:TIGR02679 domain-containing protein [Anaerotalea alkaliphila]|uniref:DUF2399 domain-containing protein n=1 Tax=Anaerotalea alkaliphila TaxID=2662126 RepID=A0A7X5HUA5_9FIRM|nr:TIGR02679 domain-containing protein [Anaerotalea alkaliphila]NDL66792.1 DUF2399 domain-containing protein [Anaerotalea alkaliphila]